VLRIEAGTPEYGIDIDESNLPQEVGRMEQAVSFIKGCYIGQETVARIRTYGHVNRLLIGVKLAENREVPSGAGISRDGVEVGRVTSSVVSPAARTGIAMGYVRRGSNEPGTLVEISAGDGSVRGEVCGLPIVAHPRT
jgi:folate-binding protein YgfZ